MGTKQNLVDKTKNTLTFDRVDFFSDNDILINIIIKTLFKYLFLY